MPSLTEQNCPNCQLLNRPGARFCQKCGTLLPTNPFTSEPPAQPNFASGLGTGRLSSQTQLAGRYHILQKIGQGGMGAVYQAIDSHIANHICAIKEMSDMAITDSAEKAQALQAFHRESELLATLSHPNIPRVMDRFSESGRHYLVMEYVRGETLQQKLDRGEGPFSEPQLLSWTHQLCDVLAYLHRQSPPIIFRDIKPDNIMIDENGQVKLIDFGIVRFFKPGKNKDTTHLGTPGYAPPEQYGKQQTDPRSDIYALGATLFYLATGKPPDEYPPYQLPAPGEVNPNLSSKIAQVIVRATQVQTNQRWQNMGDMKAALPASLSQTAGLSSGDFKRPTGQPTSRPTTKLLLQAAKLSNRQLALFGGGSLGAILLATWLLTPILQGIPLFWRNVSTLTIVAPLAYAATRQAGVMGVAHALVAVLGGVVVWLQGAIAGNYGSLLLGAAISTLVMAGLVRFLPRILGRLQRDDPGAWQREVGWLAFIAVAGHIIFQGFATDLGFALNPIAWLSAALLATVGWFVGDLIQGYFFMRQTGFTRP